MNHNKIDPYAPQAKRSTEGCNDDRLSLHGRRKSQPSSRRNSQSLDVANAILAIPAQVRSIRTFKEPI